MAKRAAPRLRVGIVDEQRLLCEVLTAVLEEQPGYAVAWCCAPGEPLHAALVEAPVPDLLLVSVTQVGDAAWKAVETLLAEHTQLCVLLLCHHVDEAAVLRGYRMGVRAVLLPHISRKDLPRILEAVLHAGVYHDAHTQRILLANPDGLSLEERRRERLRAQVEGVLLQVLECICRSADASYKAIADKLNLNKRTVERYANQLCEIFGVKGKTELALSAVRLGIVRI